MVITNSEDSEDGVYKVDYYTPYYYQREFGIRVDAFSRKIMDIKIKEESPQRDAAIRYFYNELDPVLDPDIAITCVPSHDPAAPPSGILLLARRLAAKGRIDATSCIRKLYKTESMHSGGIRNSAMLRGSLELAYPEQIEGRDVLLIDDVFTTGTSMDVCKSLLGEANPRKVVSLVLGYTRHLDQN